MAKKQYDHQIDLDDDDGVEINLTSKGGGKSDDIEVEVDPIIREPDEEVAEWAPPVKAEAEPEPEPEPEPVPEEAAPPPRKGVDPEVAELRAKLAAVEQYLVKGEQDYANQRWEAEGRSLDAKYADARKRLSDAKQSGDTDAEAAALEEMTDIKVEKKARELQRQNAEQVARQPQPAPVQQPAGRNPYTEKWLRANSWFGAQGYEIETSVAQVIDTRMAQEGWSPDQEGYFEEMNKRIASKVRTVKPASIKAPSKTQAPPVSAPRSAPTQQGRPGVVRLDATDFALMRKVSLDPNNADHRKAYAKQKMAYGE